MSLSPFAQRFEDLPPSLAVFPLPGVLLLPRGRLPLNVFEPRYVAMVDDSLGGDRLIGMIQPRLGEHGAPPLYDVGCAGRLTSVEETDDGRYLITLTGLCRFRVDRELPTTRGYRRVQADWQGYREDYVEQGGALLDRSRLRPALDRFFNRRGIKADWQAIDETADERLITTLAMVCPFAPEEKQALIEARSILERARLMMGLIEMAALSGPPEGTLRH